MVFCGGFSGQIMVEFQDHQESDSCGRRPAHSGFRFWNGRSKDRMVDRALFFIFTFCSDFGSSAMGSSIFFEGTFVCLVN